VLLLLQLPELEQLSKDEGHVVVPRYGRRHTGWAVDGDVGRRRWLPTWRHQLLRWKRGWCSRMDQGEGAFSRAHSLVREKFGRKATSNDCARRVQSMYKGVPLGGLGSAAGNKLETMVYKGEPLSTLIKMGGRSAISIVPITRFVAPGHEAPFSPPQSVAFAAGTIVHADVLQLRPVGVVEDN
jgi:hypothetical protein